MSEDYGNGSIMRRSFDSRNETEKMDYFYLWSTSIQSSYNHQNAISSTNGRGRRNPQTTLQTQIYSWERFFSKKLTTLHGTEIDGIITESHNCKLLIIITIREYEKLKTVYVKKNLPKLLYKSTSTIKKTCIQKKNTEKPMNLKGML